MPSTNQRNVADLPLPGTVLEPNDSSSFQQVIEPDNLSQFGQEMPKPGVAPSVGAAQVDANGVPTDPTLRGRYEFHQSRADKAEARARQLEEQFKAIEPVMPLINVIQKDAELQNTVRTHLTGKKPVEAPQRPDSYNDVEAYSNPESTSFKYRIANERYRDERINMLQREVETSHQTRQQELDQMRKEQANQQAALKFQQEIIQAGIAPEEVPEFFNLVNGATQKDMVDYFRWKKGGTNVPRYETPTQGYPSRPSSNPNPSGPIDIGEDILKLSREFR